MVFVVVLAVILAAVVAAAAFDIVPLMLDILRRRGMGTFKSAEDWFCAANKTAEKWLENGVPTVPRNAEKRLRIIDYLKGEYKVDAIQHWQEGSLLLALNETGSESAEKFADKALSDGSSFKSDRVDTAMLAFAVLCSEKTDKNEIRPQMDAAADVLLKKYRRTGGIPYNKDDDVFFVDTVGLVCPFLIRYAFEYGSEEAFEAAVKTIIGYAEKGLHRELGVPVHCYNKKTGAPLGIYGWGRGCGWWAAGLADSHAQLSLSDGHEEEKVMLERLITDFSERMVALQCPDGAFDRTVLNCSGADSSATAMLAYFLAYAGKVTGEKKYISAAEKAMGYIFSSTRKDGTVDYSQGDTIGIGFYSTASIVVPAAQGFALRAYLMLKEENIFD